MHCYIQATFSATIHVLLLLSLFFFNLKEILQTVRDQNLAIRRRLRWFVDVECTGHADWMKCNEGDWGAWWRPGATVSDGTCRIEYWSEDNQDQSDYGTSEEPVN